MLAGRATRPNHNCDVWTLRQVGFRPPSTSPPPSFLAVCVGLLTPPPLPFWEAQSPTHTLQPAPPCPPPPRMLKVTPVASEQQQWLLLPGPVQADSVPALLTLQGQLYIRGKDPDGRTSWRADES